MPEPCHPPCPRPWAGKTDRGLLSQGLEEMEALAPPESWEDQTAGPAWDPMWSSSSRDRLANALLYSESGISC